MKNTGKTSVFYKGVVIDAMKTLLTITSIIFTQLCLSQTQQNCDAVYELKIPFVPASLHLVPDVGLSLPFAVNNNIRKVTYKDVPPGHYKIRISGQGQPTRIIDSILVAEGQQLILKISIDGPCLYNHPANYIPVCPKNHKDSIIPILYGLIVTAGDTFVKDKKDLKVKYAGCVTTGCDPQFYCKQHDIEF